MSARGRYLLNRDVRDEYANVQKAGKKRSLWASIGGLVGGAIATAFTGGLASPLLAAAVAGGAVYAGGHAGSIAARQSKLGGSGRVRGGKFLQGSREGVLSQLNKTIASSAVKSALGAGIAKGGWGAAKHGAETGDWSKLWKAKEGATGWKAGTMAGGAKGGFGKALDIGGSWGGKKVAARTLGKEITKAGWIDPNLQDSVTKGGKPIVAMDRRIHSPRAKSARIDTMLQERGPLGKAPSIEEMRSAGRTRGGPGFQKSDQTYDISFRTNEEQSAIRALNQEKSANLEHSRLMKIQDAKYGGDRTAADLYKNVQLDTEKVAKNTEWMESLAGNEGVLEPASGTLRYPGPGKRDPSSLKMELDLNRAAAEGWNEPMGKGVDVDRLFNTSQQTSRSGYMKELELGRVLETENIVPLELRGRPDMGFATPTKIGEPLYSASEGMETARKANIGGTSFSPQFDMGVRKPYLTPGEDWRNTSWKDRFFGG